MEKVNNNKYEYQFRLETAVIIIINFVDVMETNYPRQIFLFYFNNYFCSVSLLEDIIREKSIYYLASYRYMIYDKLDDFYDS